MTSYKSECIYFQRSFKRFVQTSSSYLMQRGRQTNTNSKIDRQIDGLLVRKKTERSKPGNKVIYNHFKHTIEFIKNSEYIIEYIPYSDITHIIHIESSMDTHEDIQSLIVNLWNMYKREIENDQISDNKELKQESFHFNSNSEFEFAFFEGQEDFEKLERAVYKIVEHIKLAILQRSISLNEKKESIEFFNKEIKEKQETLDKLTNKIESFERMVDDKLQSNINSMISILGIFAAILMGAFGAIQGFTSLFANAHSLNLSTILIISSIGASSVILILFFLLNGIAKLTKKKLWSNDSQKANIIEKHPPLIITHCILIFIALVGAALELSNTKLQLAKEGFWWLVPFIWLTYIIAAISKKSFWPFKGLFKYIFVKVKSWWLKVSSIFKSKDEQKLK